jgi:hypothetical protein
MAASDAQPALSAASVVVASKEQVSSELAGEAILLSLQTAMYYGVGGVGARIWDLLREPVRVADVRDAILREYDVEPDRCERDLLAFLRELAAQGLIEIRNASDLA